MSTTHGRGFRQHSKKLSIFACVIFSVVIMIALIGYLFNIIPIQYSDCVIAIVQTVATFSGSIVGFYMTNSAVEKYSLNKFSTTDTVENG